MGKMTALLRCLHHLHEFTGQRDFEDGFKDRQVVRSTLITQASLVLPKGYPEKADRSIRDEKVRDRKIETQRHKMRETGNVRQKDINRKRGDTECQGKEETQRCYHLRL